MINICGKLFFWLLTTNILFAQDYNFDYLNLNESEPIGCSEETFVLFEEEKETIVIYPPDHWPGDTRGWLHFEPMLTNTIYENLDNKYDFWNIIVHAEDVINWSALKNNKGLGLGTGQTSSDEFSWVNRYRSTISLDIYDTYKSFQLFTPDSFFSVNELIPAEMIFATHEIGHHWCCNLRGFYEDTSVNVSSHFPTYFDLFSGDTSVVSVNTSTHWIVTEQDTICLSRGYDDLPFKFSPIEQYTMGLLAPENVPPVIVNEFETIPGTNFETLQRVGPSCRVHEPNFINQREVSIEHLIAQNGPLEKTVEDSQKNFRVGWLIIVPFGHTLDSNFVAYVNILKDSLPAYWEYATDNRSRIVYDCDETLVGTQKRQANASMENGFDFNVMTQSNLLTIEFVLDRPGDVAVKLLSVKGEVLAQKANTRFQSGISRFSINIESKGNGLLKSGTLILVAEVNGHKYHRKVAYFGH